MAIDLSTIIYFVTGIVYIFLGYTALSKSRTTKKQIISIMVLLLGILLFLLSLGVIKLI
jgi:drug/metabolite transporter (DMT)-like permease